MTDQHDDHEAEPELRESQLPPADDERIRRLLAEARHTEPMPEAVATRLDGVLANLSADRAQRRDDPAHEGRAHEDHRAPVVDLAARRRRRTAANLLVAAAAVLVVGFGISQVLPHGMGGSDGEPAATSAEDNAAGGSADSGDSTARNPVPEAGPVAPSEYDGGAAGKAFQIRSESFGSDVRQARRQLLLDDKAALLEYPAPTCLTTDVGAGDVVAATYDGAAAAIVLRAPSGDVQVVDLYLCGDSTPRRSITLTAP
jgi:hypothetical protein